MQILLYEFATGGGLIDLAADSLSHALEREGAAMISALAADFAATGKHRVQVVREARLEDLRFAGCEIVEVSATGDDRKLLARHAAAADWTLVIAPETDGILLDRCRIVNDAGGRLLGPPLEFIELTSDKHRTAQWLLSRDTAAPRGCALRPGMTLPADFHYPAVLKPRDGCGSQGVRLIPDSAAAQVAGVVGTHSRLEMFCAGEAASLAFLCGPEVRYLLPPCRQLLSRDGRFTYMGGSSPLPHELAQRADALARQVAELWPALLGYIGIDLILGAAADGSGDRVIEINPRLTTSYVGLRAACRDNLAEALLQAANGRQPSLSFRAEPLYFSAAGEVQLTRPA